ncbi:MAG TPA: tetratricopeptide repeat protein, partial [Polyangia bacterium]|nr:tetratricopeptide repeat protein [Polyangia bacterium]
LPRLGLAAALGGNLGAAAVARAHEAPVGAPTPFHFPTESARVLAERGATGAVFAPDHASGYLELFVPGLRPYIDTRLILHTPGEYAEYLGLFDDPASFDALDARQRFDYVVLTTAYPDRYLGLISHLAADATWRLLYTDGFEVLFARAGQPVNLGDPGTVAGIAAALDRRYASLPEARADARLDLARLLVVLGRPSGALAVLDAVDSRPAAELRARAQLAAGDLAAAEALARVLLAASPDDVRSLTLLAEVALARQTPDEARRYLSHALAVDPYDPEARGVLARLERQRPLRPAQAHES